MSNLMCVLVVTSPAADILLDYAVTRHGKACLVPRKNIRTEQQYDGKHFMKNTRISGRDAPSDQAQLTIDVLTDRGTKFRGETPVRWMTRRTD